MIYLIMYDVAGLTQHLRSVGISISPSEMADAERGLRLTDPESARDVLAMTLTKRTEDRQTLATVVELFRMQPSDGDDSETSPTELLAPLSAEDLYEFTLKALLNDDLAGIDTAATELVARHVTIRPGAPVAGNVHVMRAYRAADPTALQSALLGDLPTSGPLLDLRIRTIEALADEKLERLRHAIETAVRRLLVADRGAASVAKAVSGSLPGETDFLTASGAEITALTDVLSALPARLEHKLRRHEVVPRSGRLDARATMRKAMAYGGTPLYPVFRPRRPPRPELIVLADISGSVATFARFTLSLAHSLHGRFHSVRSFVFVDHLDEVTHLVSSTRDMREVAEQIDGESLGVGLDGHSDYGRVFKQFAQRFGPTLGPRTVVLILGDARTNYHDPGFEALAAIQRRAGRVYWLNPERSESWNEGDSVIAGYASHCSGVHECRTVHDLQEFVLRHVN